MATRRVKEFLYGSGVRFATITHSPAYTAQQTAEYVHIPGHSLAKTVIVWIDGHLAMAVVPADKDVDFDALSCHTGADEVRLAKESEFKDRFLGCQVGTVPPFGILFGIETFLDRQLTQEDHIAFTAGTHTDVIVMDTSAYQRLVRPVIVQIACEPVAYSQHTWAI
jgi:Ala-tRNA(Pro) deacylase